MKILNDLVENIDFEFQQHGYIVKETEAIQKIAMSDDFVGQSEKK